MSCCKPRDLGFYKSGKPVAAGKNLEIPLVLCVEELHQGDKFNFCIPCCFDYPDCVGNVNLIINGVVSLTAIKIGTVKSDQIKPRQNYCVVIGTEFNTASILNDLCCSKYTYPQVSLSGVKSVAESV